MNRQMVVLCAASLALIAAGAVLVGQVGSRQHLAAPGVKTHPLAGSIRLEAELPERVEGYNSERLEVDDITLGALPRDTSFGMRRYKGSDGFILDLRVVLMGRDAASMHKPQICLTGQGWNIDDTASAETTLRVHRPYEYDLPVVKLVARAVDAQNRARTGVYVYWYVADDALSASTSGLQRMWWMATKLLRTGVLQRWSYISCFSVCAPGQEQAAFDRMSRFITDAVPDFQLYPKSKPNTVATVQ